MNLRAFDNFNVQNHAQKQLKLPFLTSNDISDLNFDTLSINSEPALNSRTTSLLSHTQQKHLKQRLLDHQRALQITVEIKRLQAEKEKLEQEQFLRDMVKLKQKQRAREVISQSSNADIRYALHTTFTHNLPGDEDLGEVPRGMGLETQCLDHSARQQNETDLQTTIVYPQHSATSPRYLSYHYHRPNSELPVENKVQTLKASKKYLFSTSLS